MSLSIETFFFFKVLLIAWLIDTARSTPRERKKILQKNRVWKLKKKIFLSAQNSPHWMFVIILIIIRIVRFFHSNRSYGRWNDEILPFFSNFIALSDLREFESFTKIISSKMWDDKCTECGRIARLSSVKSA